MRLGFSIWDLIDKIEEWWPWHSNEDGEEDVDPNLNPVLLVPGIGGSILNAVNEKGKKERIWVRLFAADHEFRSKLWSMFDPATGRTECLCPNTRIEVPDDRYGLYSCDILDPDVLLRLDVVYYFHDLIRQMLSWGYCEGTTLFGFGYDFRQSNRLPEVMDSLHSRLKGMHTSTGKKVKIVSHSMGGLIVKSFLSLYPEIFEKYVDSWIAVTVPFQGAPGFIMDCLLTGVEFVKGWQRELFIAKWSMHQLLIECPSVYELMASSHHNWRIEPELRVWRKRTDGNGNSEIELESFGPRDSVGIMMGALTDNIMNYNGEKIPLPLNHEILVWAMETSRILRCAKLPESIKFYNVFGTDLETPFHVCYGTADNPVTSLGEILNTEADFECVDGDGTVPAESAMADDLAAVARVGIPGDHRGILNDERFFRIVKHWLRAGEPDPFYDPLNDYVIIPTKADFEKFKRKRVFISPNSGETGEVLGMSPNENDEDFVIDEQEYIATITTGPKGAFEVRAEAHAHVNRRKEYKTEEDACLQIDTVGVAEGADDEKTSAALDQAITAASDEAIAANSWALMLTGTKKASKVAPVNKMVM